MGRRLNAPARLAVTVLSAVTLLTVIADVPARAAVTLTSGHVDVIDINYASGDLSVKVLDETTQGTRVVREPADVVFQVPAAAKITVPGGSQWSFLGPAGSTAWVLPQSQVSGLLWAGWNAADVASGVFSGNLTLQLTGVTGGRFSVYQTSLGSPTVLFSSEAGGPKAQSIAPGAHAHRNWAFNTATTYKVTFRVSGTLAGTSTVKTAEHTFTFQVVN